MANGFFGGVEKGLDQGIDLSLRKFELDQAQQNFNTKAAMEQQVIDQGKMEWEQGFNELKRRNTIRALSDMIKMGQGQQRIGLEKERVGLSGELGRGRLGLEGKRVEQGTRRLDLLEEKMGREAFEAYMSRKRQDIANMIKFGFMSNDQELLGRADAQLQELGMGQLAKAIVAETEDGQPIYEYVLPQQAPPKTLEESFARQATPQQAEEIIRQRARKTTGTGGALDRILANTPEVAEVMGITDQEAMELLLYAKTKKPQDVYVELIKEFGGMGSPERAKERADAAYKAIYGEKYTKGGGKASKGKGSWRDYR